MEFLLPLSALPRIITFLPLKLMPVFRVSSSNSSFNWGGHVLVFTGDPAGRALGWAAEGGRRGGTPVVAGATSSIRWTFWGVLHLGDFLFPILAR